MLSGKYDTIIIGGGFYGLRIAQFLKEELKQKRILVLEKENDVMLRASYNNQARVHNGYHYPRSVLTALRSRVNLPNFTKEYSSAIDKSFEKYYAVARSFSNVSANQFERFFNRIGSEIEKAPQVRHLFNTDLIEEVFLVKEYAFNARTIKSILLKKLSSIGVGISVNEHVLKISSDKDFLNVQTDKQNYKTKYVINTTYSSINLLNFRSSLPTIPLKHEVTEICLVSIPDDISGMAFTIMCGPFFSLMPFPDKNLYSLSHVRYTPHSEWQDKLNKIKDGHAYLNNLKLKSNFPKMIADAKRYMPLAKNIKYSGNSLWEIKTVLPRSEKDDSRPIMYLVDHGNLKNYICIMGGKIDNVYDVLRELKVTYGKN